MVVWLLVFRLELEQRETEVYHEQHKQNEQTVTSSFRAERTRRREGDLGGSNA